MYKMYSWGGDTGGWRGSKKYDYGSARAHYDKMAVDMPSVRTYDRRKTPDMDLTNAKGKNIQSDSEDPVIVAVDVTGSMSAWPGEIFDRLPLFYQTLAKHRPGMEIAFAAIGDATIDGYPLQITDFAKEPKDLEKKLKALGCEGGGGGHITESYELFGYYMMHHCKTPKAKSPFLLIYGDEAFYDNVEPKQVKHYIGDDLESSVNSTELWKGLMQKYELYHLHKLYGSGGEKSTDSQIIDIWRKAIGRQRVIELPFEITMEDGSKMPGYQRAGDIGMGLIAKRWGEYRDFGKSLDARHDDPSVKASVHHSLRHIDADPAPVSRITAKSKTAKSKATKSLLD